MTTLFINNCAAAAAAEMLMFNMKYIKSPSIILHRSKTNQCVRIILTVKQNKLSRDHKEKQTGSV